MNNYSGPAAPPKNRSASACLISCLVVVGGLVVLGILAVVLILPKAKKLIQHGIANEHDWSAVGTAWTPPPPGSKPAAVFPQTVGEYRRAGVDNHAAVADVGLPGPGEHALYKDATRIMDLYVYHGSALDGEALQDRVRNAVNVRNGSRTVLNINNRFTYSTSRPKDKGTMWTSKGWTFFARTTDGGDPDAFLKEYLRESEEKNP